MTTAYQSSMIIDFSVSSYFEEESFQDNTDEEKSPSRPFESPIHDDDSRADTPIVVPIINRDNKQCGNGDDASTVNRSERTDSDETIIPEDFSTEFTTKIQQSPCLSHPVPSSSSRSNNDIPSTDTDVSAEDPVPIEPITLVGLNSLSTSLSSNNTFTPLFKPQQMRQLRQSAHSHHNAHLHKDDQIVPNAISFSKQTIYMHGQFSPTYLPSDSNQVLLTAIPVSKPQTSLASLSSPSKLKQTDVSPTSASSATDNDATKRSSLPQDSISDASTPIPVNIMVGFKGSTSEIITNILYRQSELRVCVIGRNLFDVVTPTGCSSYPLKPDLVSSLVDIIDRQHTSGKLDIIFLDLAGMSLNMGSLFTAIKKNNLTNNKLRIFNILSLFDIALETSDPGAFVKMAELVAVSDQVLLYSSFTGRKETSTSQHRGLTEKIAQITNSINPFISTNSISTSSFLARAMDRRIDYEKICSIDTSFLSHKVHVSTMTSIRCISITINGDMNVIRFNQFMNPFYTTREANIFKCFGYLAFDVAAQGPEDKFAFIGIRKELTVVRTRSKFQFSEPRKSIIILICRRDLEYHELIRGLKSCLVKSDTKIDVIL